MTWLSIVRHAKAEPYGSGDDHERALDPRGRSDALLIGQRMAAFAPRPQALVSSSARRCQETSAILAAELELPVTTDPGLYHARGSGLLVRANEFEPGLEHAVLVGHNPAVAELGDLLCGGLGRLHVATGSWILVEWSGAFSALRPDIAALRSLVPPRVLR